MTVEYLYCTLAFQEANNKTDTLIRRNFKNLMDVVFLDVA